MRRSKLRLRALILLFLPVFLASSAAAWVQINLRDQGVVDDGWNVVGGSLTFRLEQDGSFDTNAGEPASELDALRATFTAINNVADSNAAANEAAMTFDLATHDTANESLMNNLNSVFFANADGAAVVTGALAVARIRAAIVGGTDVQIVECDVIFNNLAGNGFTWTIDAGNTDPLDNTFDIQEVMNQEVQHCFGFEHTPVAGAFNSSGHEVSGFSRAFPTNADHALQASLYPVATGTTEGRTFEQDDIAAFSGLYPSGATRGNISGSVSPNIKGAHVVAVSTGAMTIPVAGTLSGVDAGDNGTGDFTIRGLPPGDYFVRIEPLLEWPNNPFSFTGDTAFTGGTDTFPPEFWSGAMESATDAAPDATDAAVVTVTANTTTMGVNIVTNTLGALNNNTFPGTTIGTNTFADFRNISGATTEGGEPDGGCFLSSAFRTVWYSFTAPSNGTITFSTEGSSYDTAVQAYTGNAVNSLIPEAQAGACSDDLSMFPDASQLQSEVSFAATSGQTYRFQVSDTDFDFFLGFDLGDTLVVNFTFAGAVNAVPVAVNDSYTTGANEPLVIADGCPGGGLDDLLCNDTDADGDPLSVVTGTVTSPANGTVMVNADGSFTYTPNLGFSGMDTFTYQVTDGTTPSNFATVTITVNQCTRDFDNDSADNQFETTTNWNPDGVPGSGTNEVLCIGGAFPVTHSVGGETIFSLRHTSTMPFTMAGGGLQMTGPSEIGSGGLILTSGTLDTFQTTTINGPVTWDAGTMAGGGGTFVFAGGGTLGTAGTKTLSAVQITNPNGQTVTWTDGNINVNDVSVFTNAGIFDAQGNNQLNTTSGSGTFNNTGTFSKSAGGGATQTNNNILFISSGTVNVTNGEFNLGGPGTFSGPVNVATTFSITHMFGGTVVDFNSGANVSGAGLFTVAESTVNFNNGSALSTAVEIGSALNDLTVLNLTTGGPVTIPSLEFVETGAVNANTALTIDATGLIWPCGTFGGTQTVTLNGPGTLNDTACGDKILAGGNFVNNNLMTWTGGNIQLNAATAQLTNNSILSIETDADITDGGAGGALINMGVGFLRKRIAVGTTDIGVAFLNQSAFLIETGTVNFTAGFTQDNGSTGVNPGTTLASTGLLTFDGGVLEGGGSIIGNVDINAATLSPGFNLAGSLSQTGILNMNSGGAFNVELGGLTAGTQFDQYNVTGTANLAAGSTLNVTLFGGFTPMVGDTFNILTATTRNGQFTNLNLPDISPNSFQVNNLAGLVQLEVVPNAAPNAVDDNAMTLEDTFVDINVLANDTDTDGPMALSVSGFTQGANGAVTDQGGGVLRYTPNADFNGMDTFTYDVTDSVNTVTANVNVTITAVNDAPTFTGGPNVMVAEDAGAQVVAGWATAISPGGGADEAAQVLTFNVTNNTNAALFSVQPAVDAVTGTLTFTSALNANGSADITIVLMDNGGTANGGVDTSASFTFTITVTPVNDAPVANADMFTVVQNTMNNALDVLANDTDVDGDALTVTQITVAATNGTATANGTNVLYTPNMGFTGMDTFTYEACDPSAACATAVVTVDVIANFPPNAVDDVANTNEDSFVDTNVLANDDDGGDGGPLSVVGFTQGANGTVTDQGGGILRYTPNPDFNGMDSYTYDVSDTFSTDTGTVTVTVVAVNDAPSFTGGPDVTVAEDSGAQTVAAWATNIMPGPATATDEAGQVLTFNVTANTNAALFSAQPAVNATTGDLTFTPAPDAFGSSDITIVLMDDGGTANGGVDTSASFTFTITVTNVNDPPVITAGPTSNPVSPIPGNTSTGANVAFSITVTDADNDPLTFSWTGACGTSSVEDPTLACPFGVGLSVDVTVDDGNGGMDMGNIVVDVTDYSIAANCTSGMPPCNSATMATIAAGQAVDFDLTATGINGTYAANITYSCLNLPAQTTCTFTPSASVTSAPPGGVVTMLRIQTSAPGFAQLHAPSTQQSQPPFLALFMTVPGLALFGLVLAGGRRKRRSLGTLCLLAILLVMATVLVGCGSGGDFFTSLGNPGTPTGSHSITIRAQGAGTLQRSVDLTVVVQ